MPIFGYVPGATYRPQGGVLYVLYCLSSIKTRKSVKNMWDILHNFKVIMIQSGERKYTSPYYISPIEIGLFGAKITYLKNASLLFFSKV